MAFYPQTRLLEPKHRLFYRTNNLLILNSAILIATNYLATGKAEFDDSAISEMHCIQHDLIVKLPLHGPLETALADKKPDSIIVKFEPKSHSNYSHEDLAGLGPHKATYSMWTTFNNMISPIFVEFYEAYRQLIHDKYRLTERYPPLWRFARVIRNAISHGGAISINSEKETPVAWESLKYSFADNETRVFDGAKPHLGPSDLIVLMFEMSDLLDDEGCPI